jgi:hypothetical protein
LRKELQHFYESVAKEYYLEGIKPPYNIRERVEHYIDLYISLFHNKPEPRKCFLVLINNDFLRNCYYTNKQ